MTHILTALATLAVILVIALVMSQRPLVFLPTPCDLEKCKECSLKEECDALKALENDKVNEIEEHKED